jgi:hypothetical protein
MNNLPRNSWNFALALTLAFGSAAVLAKGPGTQMSQDGASSHYRCSTSAAPLETTSAKSPQQNRSYACAPSTPAQGLAPTGATTAKTPSRKDGHLMTLELANDIPAGQGCMGKC